jgi:type II secretory pathway component GspD/PulD (secretin)
LIAKIDQAPEQVVIQAMIVKVPAEFVKAAGLDDKGGAASVSVLTERETRMLRGLIDREPKTEVLSRPTLMVNDNQTGFAQLGQNYPYLGQGTSPAGGKEPLTVHYLQLGVTMRITPRVQPDKKAVLLDGEFTECSVAESSVQLGNGVTAPAFNEQSFRASTIVPFGGSLVAVNGPVGKGSEGNLVTLTLLTVAPVAKQLCDEAKSPTPALAPMPVPTQR